jgi:hypothetical protein
LKSHGKSIPHFKLEEALKQRGCAVCQLVKDAGLSYLDNLLYELVNDPDVQTGFRDSLGLCNRHAYRMTDMRDGLGTSILYRVVVRRELELLSQVSEPSKRSSVLSGFLWRSSTDTPAIPEPGIGCMVCRAEEEAEERYLRVLLEGAEDGSLEGLLDGPGAACVRHLSRASALAGGGLPRPLIDVSRAALEELEADLDEFIRHKDHRFADEPWGKERDAWKRAVERIVGQRELGAS